MQISWQSLRAGLIFRRGLTLEISCALSEITLEIMKSHSEMSSILPLIFF